MDHPTPDATSAPEPTLSDDAGRPIGPPQGPGTPAPWQPGESWRPGGGIHGHDVPRAEVEPLAGAFASTTAAAPATRHRPPAFAHAGGTPTTTPRHRTRTAVLFGLVAGVVGAVATVVGLFVAGAFDDPPAPAPVPGEPQVIQVTEIVTPEETQIPAAAVARKVVPSIVAIEIGTEGPDGFLPSATGSGVVITDEGQIITNRHVVDGADVVRVVFQDGRIFTADVIGTDAVTDLAVLDIDASGLVPIEIGSSENLAIGDPAIAVGNPLGLMGGASVTVGVLSAFDREVEVGTGDRLVGMLQTDAPITRGSSGGALVDARGRLIGITTAIGVSDAGAEGIGFAIPVELAIRITDELAETGTVRHAFLGVTLENIFADVGPAQVPSGAGIIDIRAGSSAEEYGLLVGDRIVELDGLPVTTNVDVVNTLRRYRVGDSVTLRIVRGDEALTVDLVLGVRPEDL